MPVDELRAAERAEVESFLAEWLAGERIPGAGVAVYRGGETVYAEGFGARTLEGNEPASAETLFGVGSCTKPFTAAAVLRLAEAGELGLLDPVDDYVPHLSDAPGEPITVGELLSHTSGLPSDGSAGPLISRSLGAGHIEVPLSSEADFRRHVEGAVDRRVTDRETFFYNNSGYTILGRVVESVTGETFADHLEANLLAPLGMERSTFSRAGFEAEADRMTPYLKQDGDSTESGFPFDPLVHPPGGLVSSARELLGFVRLLAGDDIDGVLSEESIETMATPRGTFGTYFDGREVGYGYGLMIEEYLGDRLVGHGGSIAVSNAWFGHLEGADLGVAVACTTGPEAHPADAGMGVMALLEGEAPEAVQPHYRLVGALEAAAGEYEDYRELGGATVERVGGGLRLEAETGLGSQELLLVPTRVDDDVLVCTTTLASGMTRQARFEFDDEGVSLCFERHRLERAD